MNPGARAQAAIDILADILGHHRPALQALADWGRTHRFAGSADRAAIGDIVLQALRQRASLAWRMEDDSPRALVLAHLAFNNGMTAGEIAELARLPHAISTPTDTEMARLQAPRALEDAPAWVRGDCPEWVMPLLQQAFGEQAIEEAVAQAQRAPLDIRINTLRGDVQRAARQLAHHQPQPTPYAPHGLRFLPHPRSGRLPRLESEPAFARGLFEIQDEGSQIAALLCAAQPGWQVLDYCAGGGGKTLALAAQMNNRGQIHAFDADAARLAAIVPRLKRAGAHNVQLHHPARRERLEQLQGRMHLVLVDAPCTGSGTWRRKPDAKWRLKPQALERHVKTQAQLLDEAATYVRPGGLLAYATCSILPPENDEQIKAFLARNQAFRPIDWRQNADALRSLPPATASAPTLQLTPHQHGTDGFFIALMRRVDA